MCGMVQLSCIDHNSSLPDHWLPAAVADLLFAGPGKQHTLSTGLKLKNI
jgi:hypothetical protein